MEKVNSWLKITVPGSSKALSMRGGCTHLGRDQGVPQGQGRERVKFLLKPPSNRGMWLKAIGSLRGEYAKSSAGKESGEETSREKATVELNTGWGGLHKIVHCARKSGSNA